MRTKTHPWIVEQAMSLFMESGVRSVTMDDVASHLRMSKKTIYAYFPKKDDLIREVMTLTCDQERMHVEAIQERGLNAIEEKFEIGHHVIRRLQQIHPSIHYDLRKYYPDGWQVFQDHKEDFIRDRCIRNNIEKGMNEGLYRHNIDADVISRLYIERIDMVFDPAIFPTEHFTFSGVYMELFKYHIRGIASEKGLAVLNEKLNQDHLFRND